MVIMDFVKNVNSIPLDRAYLATKQSSRMEQMASSWLLMPVMTSLFSTIKRDVPKKRKISEAANIVTKDG